MTKPRPWRRIRRWVWITLGTLAVLQIAYLIAANLAIDSEWLQEKINHRPQKIRVTWSGGHTYFPGRVVLENVEVTGQSKAVQYWAKFDRGSFSVGLLRLAFRHAVIKSGRVSGLETRVRRRLDRKEIPEAKVSHYPPIPDLANPPQPPPEELYPRKKPARVWTVDIGDLHIDPLREVWINGLHLEGASTLAVGMSVRSRDYLEFDHIELTTESGKMSLGSNVLTEGLALDADIEMARYQYRDIRGKDVLDQISGRIQMNGRLHDLSFLDDHGATQAGIRFGGTGTIAADLDIRSGGYLGGSTISVDAERLEFGFLDYWFESSGTVVAQVEEEDGGTIIGTTEVHLGALEGHRVGHEVHGLEGPGFTYRGVVEGPSLKGREKIRELAVELPDIQIPNMKIFNNLLPPTVNTEILSGSATISSRYQVHADGSASGRVLLEADQIIANAHGNELDGSFGLDAHYEGPDFRRKEFDLGGTSLSFTEVFLTDKQRHKKHDEGWWFHLDLPIAHIDLTEGTAVDASASFTMRDIRPVVALLREEGKAPGWFRFLPNIKDIAGHAVVDMEPGAMKIERLDLTGKGTVIKAHMRLGHEQEKEWAFFVKYKLFTVGVAFQDDQKSWKMKHARQWYDEQLAAMGVDAEEYDPTPEAREAPE